MTNRRNLLRMILTSSVAGAATVPELAVQATMEHATRGPWSGPISSPSCARQPAQGRPPAKFARIARRRLRWDNRGWSVLRLPDGTVIKQ
jgi:hypothetical protein